MISLRLQRMIWLVKDLRGNFINTQFSPLAWCNIVQNGGTSMKFFLYNKDIIINKTWYLHIVNFAKRSFIFFIIMPYGNNTIKVTYSYKNNHRFSKFSLLLKSKLGTDMAVHYTVAKLHWFLFFCIFCYFFYIFQYPIF